MCFVRELILFCQRLEAGKGIVKNGARLCALSKTTVDLCRFCPKGKRLTAHKYRRVRLTQP